VALQYTTIGELSFARGIDARSAENQIAAGFVRDLVNADIIEGRIRKRTGYASYAGNIPLRVTRIKQTDSTNQLCFTFDGSVDLSTIPSCPILVYGKSSNIGTVTSSNTSIGNSLITLPGNYFALNLPVYVVASTVSNIPVGTYYVVTKLGNDIELSTFAGGFPIPAGSVGTITLSFGTFSTFGDTARWYTEWTTTLRKVFTSSPNTGTISALADEHSIQTTDMFVGIARSTSTSNLGAEQILWGDNGGLTPTELSVNKSTYDITAGYTNNSGSNLNVFLYYSDKSYILSQTWSQSWTVAGNTVNSVQTISAATHQLSNYNITYQLWKDDGTSWTRVKPTEFVVDSSTGQVDITVTNSTSSSITYRVILSTTPSTNTSDYNITTGSNVITIQNVSSPFLFYTLYVVTGTTLTEVIPDEYTYDDVNKELTLRFTNGTSNAIVARVYYDYGSVRVNELCVTDYAAAADVTDNAPQLTVYGISHEIAYGENKKENRRGWVTHLDSYRSPLTTHVVAGLGGNLFAALPYSDAPSVMAATMNEYYPKLNGRLATATKLGPVFWDTGSAPALTRGSIQHSGGGTNWATVTEVSYQSGTGYTRYTLSTPGKIVTGSPITINQDYLTVKGMSHTRHNGTFKVKVVDYSSVDSVVIDVENAELTSSDYDDDATSGLGGVFTDSIVTSSPSPFLVNDTLLSSFWGDETELVVLSVSGSTTVLSQVYNYLSLGAGLVITGRRTSATIPLRNLLNAPTVTNLVPGDTLSYSKFSRPLQVVSVDTVNYAITVDEAFTWEDNLSLPPSFTVSHRWIPAESPVPDSGDSLLPTTTIQHLSSNEFDNQPFLRSAMVQNNMYLTNGDDEVYKYDGNSFYRAGIIPWQPGLFLTTQSGVVGGIKLSGIEVSVTTTGTAVTLSKADALQFPVGTVIKYVDSTNTAGLILTVATNTEKSASDHTLTFAETFAIASSGTSAKIYQVYQARYGFRLNIKDRNGVTTASAVTGAEDFVVQIAPTATSQYIVNVKLVGLPAWDQYDYSNKNIELKIYRTLWQTAGFGEVPVFYEVATKQMPYTGMDGYLSFEDRLGNDTLVNGDPVVGVLSPEAVPVAWDEPARGKYVTSAGNRLVLGNVTDWPTLAISYLTAGTVPYTDYNGQKFLFRRDDTDTATATNMVDRVTYELKSNGGALTGGWSTVAGTSFSFTCIPTKTLVEKDWVYLYYGTSTVSDLAYSGWWQIQGVTTNATTTVGTGTTVTTVNVVSTAGFPSSGVIKIGSTTYTYTGKTLTSFTGLPSLSYTAGLPVTSTTATVATPLATTAPTTVPYAMFATNDYDVPVNIDGDYNMGMANGDTVNFLVPANRILRRIGMAINATMRMTNKALTNQSTFVPWIVARSEADTQGQLIVKQPRAEIKTPSVRITGGGTSYKTYINGSQSNGSAVSAVTTRYPSRILVSYNNYPEIFDNPWSVDDSLSASAIDINSSDGQEITGIIPFFGESAFGAALQSGVLVVFKQNSIYLVDLSEKASGRNAVQRIETQGLGCTAPYSIAPTKDGIAFANDSGIYRLRRDQRLEYLGRFMERNWKEKVDRDYLDLVQGHHYGVGRQYKLSVPLLADSTSSYAENSEVYVYNHTNETTDEPGGWARYTNHPATGWANLFQDAFYSTVNGSVKRVRALGEESDYRDDANAIEVNLETRAISFDQPGIRKVVSHVIVSYRLGGTSEHTTVETAPDLFDQFDETTSFKLVSQPTQDGFSTLAGQDIVNIRHSLVRRRCIYITVLISNNGKDEALEVAGMTFVVSGLNSKGILQAASTKGQSGV